MAKRRLNWKLSMWAVNHLIIIQRERKKTGTAKDDWAECQANVLQERIRICIRDRKAIKLRPYPRASLCEEAGSVCVIRTVRGVGGGEVSHLMVALSSRPSSSTAAIWGDGGAKRRDPQTRPSHTFLSIQKSVSTRARLRVPFSCVSSGRWAVGAEKRQNVNVPEMISTSVINERQLGQSHKYHTPLDNHERSPRYRDIDARIDAERDEDRSVNSSFARSIKSKPHSTSDSSSSFWRTCDISLLRRSHLEHFRADRSELGQDLWGVIVCFWRKL